MADGRSIVAAGAGRALAPRRGGALVRPRKADADLVIGRAGAELQGPRGFTHLLLFIVVAFFGIFFAWASWAKLDEVTRGDGKVIPSSQVQVVQNLEGGIVAEIPVREGDVVEPGEVLLRIDNVRAASDLRENRQRHLALLGALARLRAEVDDTRDRDAARGARRGAPRSPPTSARSTTPAQEALATEIEILESQAEQRAQELTELETRLEPARALARAGRARSSRSPQPLAASRVVSKIDLLAAAARGQRSGGRARDRRGSRCRASSPRCARPSAASPSAT